jgi:hypothetical protein
MILKRMLDRWRKKLRRAADGRGIDGNKRRDAYLDVLKDIQSPQRTRVPLDRSRRGD